MGRRRWLTIKQLAEYIGVGEQTVRNWKTNNPSKLPPHTVVTTGGKYDKWRFDSDEVDAWLQRNLLQDIGKEGVQYNLR